MANSGFAHLLVQQTPMQARQARGVDPARDGRDVGLQRVPLSGLGLQFGLDARHIVRHRRGDADLGDLPVIYARGERESR